MSPIGAMVLIFCSCVVIFALAVMIYEKRESTASQMIVNELRRAQDEVKRLNELVTSNVSTVISCKSKVEQFELMIESRLKKCDDALEVFRDQVGETREKQIKLQDALSNKRPIVKVPTGAIQVEIYQGKPNPAQTKKALGKGVKSLIREGATR